MYEHNNFGEADHIEYYINGVKDEIQDRIRDLAWELFNEDMPEDGYACEVIANQVYDDISDEMFELIDGWIPVYNWTLLQVAGSHLWLSCETPESGMPDNPTPISLIQANMFELLEQEAYESIDTDDITDMIESWMFDRRDLEWKYSEYYSVYGLYPMSYDRWVSCVIRK